MGLLSSILMLPFAPVRGVIALAEVIQQRVDEELRHPASVRRDLEAAERAHHAGEISEHEHARIQQQVLNRMTTPATHTTAREHRMRRRT